MTSSDRESADSCRALLEAHQAALLGYLARRTTGPDDAADAFAEVLVVLWRRLEDIPPGDEARLWLFGVARRVLANERRGQRRRSRLVDRLAATLPGDAFVTPAWEPPDAGAIRAGLDLLPADDAELVRLVACEGLTPAEAGQVVGLTPGHSRVRLHRARRQLRAVLDRRAPEDPIGACHDEGPARSRNRQEVG